MTLQTKLIIYVGLFMVLVGYYNYTNYTMGTQKQDIKRLEVEKHTITKNTTTKVTQANLNNLKANYNEDKNLTINTNDDVGTYRMQF